MLGSGKMAPPAKMLRKRSGCVVCHNPRLGINIQDTQDVLFLLLAVTGLLLFGEPTFWKAPVSGLGVFNTIQGVLAFRGLQVGVVPAKMKPVFFSKYVPILAVTENAQIGSSFYQVFGLLFRERLGRYFVSTEHIDRDGVRSGRHISNQKPYGTLVIPQTGSFGILQKFNLKLREYLLGRSFSGNVQDGSPVDRHISLNSLKVHDSGCYVQPSALINSEIVVAILPLVVSNPGICEKPEKSGNFYEELGVMQFSKEFYNEFPKQLKRLFYCALAFFFMGAGIACIQDMAPSRNGVKFAAFIFLGFVLIIVGGCCVW
jgi:hypothetical protein